jgi:hypothetical protein
MKTIGIAGGWVLTIIAAFFVGGMLSGSEAPPESDSDETASLRETISELQAELDEARTPRERVEKTGRARAAVSESDASTTAAAATAPDDGAESEAAEGAPAFSLKDATSGAEASRAFMEFVDAQLGRGDKGHAAIMAAIGQVWEDRETMQQLFGDETQAIRELYPWLRFLVQRETDMVGLTDYVFRTMADAPNDFADLPDDDILEIFTEGIGALLPGAVDEETMNIFRAYAEKIMATPENEQPQVVRQNRKRIERLLASFWAAPVDPEEAFAKLKSGDVLPGEIPRLLAMVPPERRSELDLAALVLPLLKEGKHEAFSVLQSARDAGIDSWRTDQAVIEGMSSGKVRAWFLQSYFQSVGHREWSDVRAFFDRALAADEKARGLAVQALSRYLQPNLRPDRAYVEDLLTRYEFDERTVATLKATYKIGE